MIDSIKNYKVFDIHTHAYPDAIAEKACINLGKFYNFEVNHLGNVKTLLDVQKKGGSSGCLLFSVATVPEQVKKINDWLFNTVSGIDDEKFTIKLLGAMHQDFESKTEEIERILQKGFKGIKIHPDFQEENIDSEKFYPVYEALEGRGIMFFHAGDDRYDFSSPKRILKIRRRYPKLKIVAAHFGGYKFWDRFEEFYLGTDFYMDTSSAIWFLPPDRSYEIINKCDENTILFGTDFPIQSVKTELDILFSLGLDDKKLKKILYENAKNLLNL